MNYHLSKNVMPQEAERKAFNTLAQNTFEFSFEDWYAHGYWNTANQPYTLFDGQKAVANVSVNKMEVLFEGRRRRYVQLGTVMTDPAYRNQGLSRFLIEQAIEDSRAQSDSIFLFANESVLDFYPKLGFEPVAQYSHSQPVRTPVGDAQKLDMNSAVDRALLKHYYEKINPFSRVQALNNYSLLMFYCADFFKEFVYFSQRCDAVIIAKQEKNTLHCFDVFCDEGKDLDEILLAAAAPETDRVQFKFTPHAEHVGGMQILPEEGDTLFILKEMENIYSGERMMFPEISHT